jgi:hypothetical protein
MIVRIVYGRFVSKARGSKQAREQNLARWIIVLMPYFRCVHVVSLVFIWAIVFDTHIQLWIKRSNHHYHKLIDVIIIII